VLKRLRHLAVGDDAPALDVKDLDGKPASLSDLRGRYVLLQFWIPGVPPEEVHTPALLGVHADFGKEPRLAIVSVCLNSEAAKAKAEAVEKKMAWSQWILNKDDLLTVAQEWGLDDGIALIGPDGKIVSKALKGEQIRKAIVDKLGGK
jgi:peroxiredoxin